VSADEQVGAAQRLPALRADGELVAGALGERPVGAGDQLLPLLGSLQAQFRLGEAGPRLRELASGGRELPVPLACALLLARVEAPLEEGDDRRGQAQPAFASAGRKRLLRATMARAASGPSFLLTFPSACGDCVDTGSLPIVLSHCCILGSCVGSAYMGGQP
jgi:hypothetical protein